MDAKGASRKEKKMKKNLKKGLFTALILAMMFLMAVPASAAPAKLNKKKAVVRVGDAIRLKVKGAKKKVKWVSTNKKVAVVNSNGIVVAKNKGTTVIIAKMGNKWLICRVTVRKADKKQETAQTENKVPEATPTDNKVPEATPTDNKVPETTPAAQQNSLVEGTADHYGVKFWVKQMGESTFHMEIANPTPTDYSLGWVNGGLVELKTDTGTYYQKITCENLNKIVAGDKMVWKCCCVPNATGAWRSMTIHHIIPLKNGLPENAGNLDGESVTIVF